MLRAITGVVVGLIAMVAMVFGVLTGAYVAMGPDRAFKPGTYDVTPGWIAVWGATTLVAAIAGGLLCVFIARNRKAGLALAGVVLALGLASAILALSGGKKDPGPRLGKVSSPEAMQSAKEPAWIAIANPIIGAVGVVIGAWAVRHKVQIPKGG